MIRNLIENARRRRIAQLIGDQFIVAMAAVFGGTILLLLLGTQVLDWYWLAILFAGSLGYGIWRVLTKAPSEYEIAQVVDARLGLHDSISTAYHFASAEHVPAEEELRRAQAAQAEEAATTADLKVALPYAMPKSVYPMVALAAVALTLFGVRYLVTKSMDTRTSLVAMAFESFFTPSDKTPAEEARNRSKRPPDTEFEKLGVATDQENQRPDLDAGADATNIVDTPDVNQQGASTDSAKMKAKTDETKVKAEGKEEGDEEGDKQKESGDSKGSGDQNNSGDQQGKDQQQKDQKGQPKEGDQSSMLDKMKDAMQNMLNKLKMQGNQSQQQQQQAQNSKDGQQSGKGQQKGDKEGQQDKNQQQGGQGEAKDQKAEAQGQQGQKNENAQGKGGDQSKQPQNADAKSGVGKSDGNKDIQMAEQAKAMGKISEILGKRQKDITGEVMIEVSSGKQQLKTSYSNEKSAHKEAGGDSNRDEVPLIYQQYVEKYFDQIHAKAPEPAKTTAPPPPASPTAK